MLIHTCPPMSAVAHSYPIPPTNVRRNGYHLISWTPLFREFSALLTSSTIRAPMPSA